MTKLIKLGYLKFFNFLLAKPIGKLTARFIENFIFASIGLLGGSLITFAFNILAIRYLGAKEFGKVNLIISLGEFFLIFCLWGLPLAVLRYLGAERENKNKIIGSSFIIVFVFSVGFILLFLMIKNLIQPILKIPANLYFWSIAYAFVFALFHLFQSFFQGLEKFKELSLILIFASFGFVLTVLIFLFYLKDFTFKTLIISNFFKSGLLIFVGLLIFKDKLFNFDKSKSKELICYGSYQTLSVLFGFFALGNIDNLMINYFYNQTLVGIYSAYYLGFTIFVGKFLNIFSQVFIPIASAIKDTQFLVKKILNFAKKTFFLLLVGNFVLLWLIFKLYGKDFVFEPSLGLIIALSTSLYFYQIVFGNILASRGIKGVKYGPVLAGSSGVLNIIFNLLLIPKFALIGAGLGTLFTVLITCPLSFYFIKRIS